MASAFKCDMCGKLVEGFPYKNDHVKIRNHSGKELTVIIAVLNESYAIDEEEDDLSGLCVADTCPLCYGKLRPTWNGKL